MQNIKKPEFLYIDKKKLKKLVELFGKNLHNPATPEDVAKYASISFEILARMLLDDETKMEEGPDPTGATTPVFPLLTR